VFRKGVHFGVANGIRTRANRATVCCANLYTIATTLFPDYLYNNLAFSWAVVEFRQYYLLPCSDKELSSFERHDERRAEESRAQMAEPVRIAPCLVVPIMLTGRDKFLRKISHILNEPRFVFESRYRGRRADDEDGRITIFKLGRRDDLRDLIGDIDDIAVAFSAEGDSFRYDLHILLEIRVRISS
jgi:hypothetical protein